MYRYCDIIPYDNDGDIGYLIADYNKLLKSVRELNQNYDIEAGTYIVTYHGAKIDLRGWEVVRKWSPTSLYNKFMGNINYVDDMVLYKLYQGYHWIPVLIENMLFEVFPYSYVLQRRRVKFGESCVFVINDLEQFTRLRYYYTYRWELQLTKSCISLIGKSTICNNTTCDV